VVVLARTRDAGASPAVRAQLGDKGVYEPEPGETVHVDGVARRCRFIRFGHDHGGDYAVVVGGKAHHVLERCVFVDRVHPVGKKARDWQKRLRSEINATSALGTGDEDG
jgi:hypothetical protein